MVLSAAVISGNWQLLHKNYAGKCHTMPVAKHFTEMYYNNIQGSTKAKVGTHSVQMLPRLHWLGPYHQPFCQQWPKAWGVSTNYNMRQTHDSYLRRTAIWLREGQNINIWCTTNRSSQSTTSNVLFIIMNHTALVKIIGWRRQVHVDTTRESPWSTQTAPIWIWQFDAVL